MCHSTLVTKVEEIPATTPPPSPRVTSSKTPRERRMSFKNRNPAVEKRDIALISMDYDMPNILSEKELKDVVRDEAKRQKLLKSQNDKKKCVNTITA